MKFDSTWNTSVVVSTLIIFAGLVFQTGILYSKVVSLERTQEKLLLTLTLYDNANTLEHKEILKNVATIAATLEAHIRQATKNQN